MQAVKAKFDGRQIILPEGIQPAKPGEVIVIFSDADRSESDDWLAAQEQVLKPVWDNPEDAEYDKL
jgi:hypothetical protein